MRRDWIIYVGLHTIGSKIFAETVAHRSTHHKLVPHTIAVFGWRRQFDKRVRDMPKICIGHRLTGRIYIVRMRQLHTKHCRLQRVKTAVEPCIYIVVTAVGGLIGERAYGSGKFVVARRHGTRISESPNIFRWIETECGSMSESTRMA